MSDDVKQIVAAYVLGCLDKKNLSQFVEYIHHGGKETEGELGELQNIISLIPILLNFENPPDHIKENIAQKILEKELITKEISRKEKPTSEIKTEEKLSAERVTKLEGKPLHENVEKLKNQTRPNSKQKKSLMPFLLIVLFIGMAGLSGYLYYLNLESTKKITKLNENLLQMKQQMAVANNFVKENSMLIDFFNMEDISIYNFTNQDTSVEAKGKLFISFSKGKALLSINISGKIFSDESLAVWAVMRKSNLLLGEIVYDPLIKYYELDKMPSFDKNNLKIISITIQKRRTGENVESRTLMISKAN